VQVRNRVRARNQLQVQTPLRHRPANRMNFGTMKSNLVGRGSRTTENCFRSSGTFHAPGSVRPMEVPSRGSKVCNPFRRDLRLRTTCEHPLLWVRLRLRFKNGSSGNDVQSFVGQVGERFGLARGVVATGQGPCSYQMTVREPRPTNGEAASHLSLFTSHLSHQGYVCS
jgi:hypothetical protein